MLGCVRIGLLRCEARVRIQRRVVCLAESSPSTPHPNCAPRHDGHEPQQHEPAAGAAAGGGAALAPGAQLAGAPLQHHAGGCVLGGLLGGVRR
jgi:hypothetical protein